MHQNIFFRRCVEGCEQFGSPACPVCPAGQICSLLAPTCDECQRTICVAQSAAPATISSSPKSSSLGSHDVGAIAGGVVGGVVTIAVVTYLVWRYCIKTTRLSYPPESWDEDTEDSFKEEKEFTSKKDVRSSVYTVGSIASTVLTRASNIIQIAYIPGVTNRSVISSPSFLVPPVPPIPLALSSSYGHSPCFEQEHFFMPGDLRDSTYSAMTSQTSLGRCSIASTVYGKNAIVSPVPAQTGICGKAAVVSVKPSTISGELLAPVRTLEYSKFEDSGLPSPAFSVGSTFLNRASAATQSKTQVNRIHQNLSNDQRSPRNSQATTFISETPIMEQGPFDDPRPRCSSISSLSAVIEEAARRIGISSPDIRESTPFGDENEVKD